MPFPFWSERAAANYCSDNACKSEYRGLIFGKGPVIRYPSKYRSTLSVLAGVQSSTLHFPPIIFAFGSFGERERERERLYTERGSV